MTKTQRLVEASALCLSAQESLSRYEAAGDRPTPGYGLSREDSKASIITRLKIARAELLTVMKELEGNQ